VSDDVQEAIDRARSHLRAALRESVEVSRALVDAALRAGGLDDASREGLAGEVRAALDDWIGALERDETFRMPAALIEPLEQALQAEIERWEKRSASDESARPVLRAFLGLRELLWEMGVRPATSDDGAEQDTERDEATEGTDSSGERDIESADHEDGQAPSSRPRVQRFNIEE
jgi:hypothetical protein